jgi:cobalt-zinc-cadmium efflux system outer membrane protein
MTRTRRVMTVGGRGGLILALVVGCASPPERQTGDRLQLADPRLSWLAETSPTASVWEKPTLTEQSTLDDYLSYAALNNAGLEAAFNRWKAELEKVPQVRTLPDPRFSYGYFIQSVETRTGPQRQRFELAQTFPWFGKLRLKGDAALAAANAAQQQYEAAKLRLFYRVKDAFYEYYYLGRAITVAQDNVELLRQVEKVARTKYESGTALYADVLKAQAELDKLDDRLHTLRELRGPTLAKLNAALNRPFDAPLAWPKSVPVIKVAVDETQLVATLAQSNPELKGLEAMAQKEKSGIALAKKAFFPDITVGVDYIQTGEAMNPNTPDSGQDPVMLMLSVNLPLWKSKYRAAESEAAARYQARREQHTDRTNALVADLKLALFKYQDAARKVTLYREALIPKARQTLEVTQRAFETGQADFLSLIDAQRTLLEFALTYERAVADHAQRLAEMEMLLGKALAK